MRVIYIRKYLTFKTTVFSAIFHKNFWSQINLVEGKINNRSANLLQKLGITGRELSKELTLSENPINWQNVDDALAQMRADARVYLKSIIDDTI